MNEYRLGPYKWLLSTGHIYKQYLIFFWYKVSTKSTDIYWPNAVRKVNWIAGVRER